MYADVDKINYGKISCLGKNLFKRRGIRGRYRTVFMFSKLLPPGLDIKKKFSFGRHQRNDFVIFNKRKTINPWLGRSQFVIIADPDTLTCELFNGGVGENGNLVAPRYSTLQYKYYDNPLWKCVKEFESVILRDKTLFRIRGAIFLFRTVPMYSPCPYGDNGEDSFQFGSGNNKYRLDCCTHQFIEESVKYWANISLPLRDDFGGAACPICLKKVKSYPGYNCCGS